MVSISPISLTVEEKLYVTLKRDGGVGNFDVQGTLSLQILNQEDGLIQVQAIFVKGLGPDLASPPAATVPVKAPPCAVVIPGKAPPSAVIVLVKAPPPATVPVKAPPSPQVPVKAPPPATVPVKAPPSPQVPVKGPPPAKWDPQLEPE